jgi:hypothetical protein
MIISVYVAAPYEDHPMVRGVHDHIISSGMQVTSQWAEEAVGKGEESLDTLSPVDVHRLAELNDRDIGRSDAMIVLARQGAGGEMFCEMRYALMLGLAVYWVGTRRILSTFRPAVRICNSVAHALDAIEKEIV